MMRLSTKGRYATRIIVRLALAGSEGPTSRHVIAEAEGITADYVEQILIRLKTAGLVRSHRGARGGYSLTKDPRQITVTEIIEATDGPIELAPCISDACERKTVCVTQRLWREAGELVEGLFSKTTVAQLVDEYSELTRRTVLSYEI